MQGIFINLFVEELLIQNLIFAQSAGKKLHNRWL